MCIPLSSCPTGAPGPAATVVVDHSGLSFYMEALGYGDDLPAEDVEGLAEVRAVFLRVFVGVRMCVVCIYVYIYIRVYMCVRAGGWKDVGD